MDSLVDRAPPGPENLIPNLHHPGSRREEEWANLISAWTNPSTNCLPLPRVYGSETERGVDEMDKAGPSIFLTLLRLTRAAASGSRRGGTCANYQQSKHRPQCEYTVVAPVWMNALQDTSLVRLTIPRCDSE